MYSQIRTPALCVKVLIVMLMALIASNGALGATYLISSSPSIPRERSEKVFVPIAQLLSKTTGEHFEYRYPVNWPGYIQDMRESTSQLLFDEPHLVGWRLDTGRHSPLLKLSGAVRFVIIARTDDKSIIQLSDLAGYTVCANAPPVLDGLVLFAQFRNPVRQPQIRQAKDAVAAYGQVLNKRCRAAVLPERVYKKLSHSVNNTRALFLSETFPSWTLSADFRVPKSLRDQIQRTLLSPDHRRLTDALIEVFYPGSSLLPTRGSDYRGYGSLLENFWGLR